MSQAPSENSDQPATQRAEELLDNVGRRIGLFAGRAGQRIQSAATSVRDGAGHLAESNPTQGTKSDQSAHAGEKGGQMMERSEEMIDQAVTRLSHYAILAGFQIQKATARLREEAEDIWAEAQNIRQENSRKSR